MYLTDTQLWKKLAAATRFVWESARAALSVVVEGPGNQTPAKLLDAQGSTTADPAGEFAGADVEGYKTLQFSWSHATGGNTSEVELWLYDGSAWYPDQAVSLDADSGVTDPYDLEGSWSRIYAKLTTAPGDTVTLNVVPHNE